MLYVNPFEGTLGTLAQANAGSQPGREKLALQELEHTFLFTLLQEMRNSSAKDEVLPRGPERDIYDEMLDDALSGEMAKSGQFGLAKQIQEQMDAGAARSFGPHDSSDSARGLTGRAKR